MSAGAKVGNKNCQCNAAPPTRMVKTRCHAMYTNTVSIAKYLIDWDIILNSVWVNTTVGIRIAKLWSSFIWTNIIGTEMNKTCKQVGI